MPLTDIQIRNAKPSARAYKLYDERGLLLLVNPKGGKWWRFNYQFQGRSKTLSLGTYPDTSLQRARARREAARIQVANGVDPSVTRQTEREAHANSFAGIAAEWLEKREGTITASTRAKAKWLLEDMLGPALGSRPIATLKPVDVLEALRRIEARGRHETAHRARAIAGQVFRYAVVTDRAEYDPTASLKGALTPVVTTNRAAITDPSGVGALLRAIHGYQGQPTVAAALKLAPVVFVRPGELRGARWEEFDLDQAVWRIPGERMKMREPHIVPLATQTLDTLRSLQTVTGPRGLLFPSLRSSQRPMSENSMNAALRRLGYSSEEVSAHGFRATASTLLNEQGYPPDVIELQLAHKERNQVRAAYNRATRLTERKAMMQGWADFLDALRQGATIIPIRKAG